MLLMNKLYIYFFQNAVQTSWPAGTRQMTTLVPSWQQLTPQHATIQQPLLNDSGDWSRPLIVDSSAILQVPYLNRVSQWLKNAEICLRLNPQFFFLTHNFGQRLKRIELSKKSALYWGVPFSIVRLTIHMSVRPSVNIYFQDFLYLSDTC